MAHWADTGTYLEVIMKNTKLSLWCWLSQAAARGSSGIHCPVNAEVLQEWHIPHIPWLMAGVTEHTVLVQESLNVACSSLDTQLKPWVLFSLCLVEKHAPGSKGETVHMALGATGKYQFRSSHWGMIYLQVLSPGLLLTLGLSVFFSSCTYTHTHV